MPESTTKKRGRPATGRSTGYDLRLPVELMAWVRQTAAAEGRTIRAFIERILLAERRRRKTTGEENIE